MAKQHTGIMSNIKKRKTKNSGKLPEADYDVKWVGFDHRVSDNGNPMYEIEMKIQQRGGEFHNKSIKKNFVEKLDFAMEELYELLYELGASFDNEKTYTTQDLLKIMDEIDQENPRFTVTIKDQKNSKTYQNYYIKLESVTPVLGDVDKSALEGAEAAKEDPSEEDSSTAEVSEAVEEKPKAEEKVAEKVEEKAAPAVEPLI